jgi:hypothetical protein
MFDNESYQKTAMSFLFMGSIVGILFEYNFWFKGNFEKFAKYNMGPHRWTETDKYRTVLRILSMHYIGHLILKIPKWGSKKRDPVYYVNFSKNIVANFWKGLFYFIIIKSVFYLLTLTNESSGVNFDPNAKEHCSDGTDFELNEKLLDEAKKEEKK